jgi:hypothetical protein
MSTPLATYNQDHPMPDIIDGQPDYRQQYASRSRPTSQQYIPQEQSTAARRYSPMRVTPTPSDRTPYVSYTPNSQAPRNPQSPARPVMYQSQSYYSTPSKQLARLHEALSDSYSCSCSISCVAITTTSNTYSHESRIALLPSTIGDTTATCHVRPGRQLPDGTNAEHTTASRTSTPIHKMHKCRRATATNECAATVPESKP